VLPPAGQELPFRGYFAAMQIALCIPISSRRQAALRPVVARTADINQRFSY
jgi:hypothetical protein